MLGNSSIWLPVTDLLIQGAKIDEVEDKIEQKILLEDVQIIPRSLLCPISMELMKEPDSKKLYKFS
jgi:hypothetical protein